MTPNLLIHHDPPLLPYSGLCFVLSHPSRFDNNRLISGYISKFFDQCIQPFSRLNISIRTLSYPGGFIPNTKVVVLMGREAQQVHIPNLNLNEARGNVYTINGVHYIATYLPQDCSDRINYEDPQEDDDKDDKDEAKEKDLSPTRRRNYRFWFYNDIKKAIRILQNKITIPRPEYKIFPNSSAVIHLLNNTHDSDLFLDIETNSNYSITVLSFSFGNTTIWTIPFIRYTGILAYDQTQLCKILRALSNSFTRNNVVIHNSLFDLFILLWRYKIPPPRRVSDTMLMHHRLYPEVEKSLGHCISLYLYEEFHKGTGVYEPRTPDQEQKLWMYNARDVFTLASIYYEIQRNAKESNLLSSMDRVNSFILPYLLLSFQGCMVDHKYKGEQLIELQNKQTQYLRILKHLIGYDIEKISPKRVAVYLYEYLRLPKPNPKWIDGQISHSELTSSGTLYKLLLTRNIPAVKVILGYRSLGKKAGFLKFEEFNGKFNFGVKIAGTNTLRIATSSLFGIWGSNSQNLEKELRRVVVPSPGKLLVQTDQSGAEALVVAYLAPPGNYRRLFECGIKVHNYVSLHLFRTVWEHKLGKSLAHLIDSPVDNLNSYPDWLEVQRLSKESDNWPSSQRYYYLAKKTCHMSNYGAGVNRFIMAILQDSEGQIVLSKKQGDYFLGTYFNLFPEILLWHNEVRQQLKKNLTLYNLFGDRRIFSGNEDEMMYKEAYAFVPQSTVGVLTSVAISEIQEQINTGELPSSWDILLNGHDAIISQCLCGEEQSLAKVQEQALAKSFKTKYGEFTMKSESSVGKDWYNLKGIK